MTELEQHRWGTRGGHWDKPAWVSIVTEGLEGHALSTWTSGQGSWEGAESGAGEGAASPGLVGVQVGVGGVRGQGRQDWHLRVGGTETPSMSGKPSIGQG